MKEISEAEFDNTLKGSTKPILVDFSAEWCPPCKMLAPVIERISLEFDDKLDVRGVNIDESPNLAQRFMISGVPTLIFFRDGNEVKRLVGFRDYDALKSEVESVV